MANSILIDLSSDLSSDYEKLYESNKYADVSINVGREPNNKIFFAHAVVLCTRSTYFEKMIVESTGEFQQTVMSFEDITSNVFEILIRFIYTGKLIYDSSEVINWISLLDVACRFELDNFVVAVGDYLVSHQKKWIQYNISTIHKCALSSSLLNKLLNYCSNLTISSPEVMFKPDNVLNLSKDTLITLLKRDEFKMEEIDIWTSVIQWAISQVQVPGLGLLNKPDHWSSEDVTKVRAVISDCIPHIRFFNIASEDIQEKVVPYDELLTKELRRDIVSYHMNKNYKPKSIALLPPRKGQAIYNNKINEEYKTPACEQTSDSLHIRSQLDVTKYKDFRVVVGIDFGTTFSGYAFAHKANPDQIESQDMWPGQEGLLKTNTVLLYDDEWNVIKWGYSALAERPEKKSQRDNCLVELFKESRLPRGLDYRKAITDYLKKLNESIQETVKARWSKLDYYSHVIKVMTVPAEDDGKARHVMRTCAFEAGIINTLSSEGLEFTSESEAAAIFCVRTLKEHNLNPGSTFLVVYFGENTIDLTTRTLLAHNKISEIVAHRNIDFCGNTVIDREFINYIASVVGKSAMYNFEEKHYASLQYMIQKFCNNVKFKFDGDSDKFTTKDFDIEEICPALMQYVNGEEKKRMEEAEWIIELDYETVESFFDPAVEYILSVISIHLNQTGVTSAILLIGELSESRYLLQKVKNKFSSQVGIIAVPPAPIAAVARGAVYYGLNMIAGPSLGGGAETRILKYTYGVEISDSGDLSRHRRRNIFKRLAQRGTEVLIDSKFKCELSYRNQAAQLNISIYTTCEDTAKYCDDPGVELFGQLFIELLNVPDANPGSARSVDFSLIFGKTGIRAQAKDKLTGNKSEALFALKL